MNKYTALTNHTVFKMKTPYDQKNIKTLGKYLSNALIDLPIAKLGKFKSTNGEAVTDGQTDDVSLTVTQIAKMPRTSLYDELKPYMKAVSPGGLHQPYNTIEANINPLGIKSNLKLSTTDNKSVKGEQLYGPGYFSIRTAMGTDSKVPTDQTFLFRSLRLKSFYENNFIPGTKNPSSRVIVNTNKFTQTKNYKFFNSINKYITVHGSSKNSDHGIDFIRPNTSSRTFLNKDNYLTRKNTQTQLPNTIFNNAIAETLSNNPIDMTMITYFIKKMNILNDLQSRIGSINLRLRDQYDNYPNIRFNVFDSKDPGLSKRMGDLNNKIVNGETYCIYYNTGEGQLPAAFIRMTCWNNLPYNIVNNSNTEKLIYNNFNFLNVNKLKEINIITDDPSQALSLIKNFNISWYNKENLKMMTQWVQQQIPIRFSSHNSDSLICAELQISDNQDQVGLNKIEFPSFLPPLFIGFIDTYEPQTFGLFNQTEDSSDYFTNNLIYCAKFESVLYHTLSYIMRNGITYEDYTESFDTNFLEQKINSNFNQYNKNNLAYDLIYTGVTQAEYSFLGYFFTGNILKDKIDQVTNNRKWSSLVKDGYLELNLSPWMIGFIGNKIDNYCQYGGYVGDGFKINLERSTNNNIIVNEYYSTDLLLNILYRSNSDITNIKTRISIPNSENYLVTNNNSLISSSIFYFTDTIVNISIEKIENNVLTRQVNIVKPTNSNINLVSNKTIVTTSGTEIISVYSDKRNVGINAMLVLSKLSQFTYFETMNRNILNLMKNVDLNSKISGTNVSIARSLDRFVDIDLLTDLVTPDEQSKIKLILEEGLAQYLKVNFKDVSNILRQGKNVTKPDYSDDELTNDLDLPNEMQSYSNFNKSYINNVKLTFKEKPKQGKMVVTNEIPQQISERSIKKLDINGSSLLLNTFNNTFGKYKHRIIQHNKTGDKNCVYDTLDILNKRTNYLIRKDRFDQLNKQIQDYRANKNKFNQFEFIDLLVMLNLPANIIIINSKKQLSNSVYITGHGGRPSAIVIDISTSHVFVLKEIFYYYVYNSTYPNNRIGVKGVKNKIRYIQNCLYLVNKKNVNYNGALNILNRQL